jgi:hypothetical protein
MPTDELEAILPFSAHAAAMNVSRPGATRCWVSIYGSNSGYVRWATVPDNRKLVTAALRTR